MQFFQLTPAARCCAAFPAPGGKSALDGRAETGSRFRTLLSSTAARSSPTAGRKAAPQPAEHRGHTGGQQTAATPSEAGLRAAGR
eukprot:jgi/Tetstr1/460365/TSEL_005664.t1